MKKLFCFLSIFAILFTSLNLTPIFKNNAESSVFPLGGENFVAKIPYSTLTLLSAGFSNNSLSGSYVDLSTRFFFNEDYNNYSLFYANSSYVDYLKLSTYFSSDNNIINSHQRVQCTNNNFVPNTLLFNFSNFYYNSGVDFSKFGSFIHNLDIDSGIFYNIDFTIINDNNSRTSYTIQGVIDYEVWNETIYIGDLLLNASSNSTQTIFVDNFQIGFGASNFNSSSSFVEFICPTEISLWSNQSSDYIPSNLFLELKQMYEDQITIVDYEFTTPLDWLTNTVGGFMAFELWPGFSLGGVFGIIFGLCFMLVILKTFFGG